MIRRIPLCHEPSSRRRFGFPGSSLAVLLLSASLAGPAVADTTGDYLLFPALE